PERRLTHNRLRIELRERPAHGPGEANPAVVPAHRLGERETPHDRVEAFRQHFTQLAAGPLDAEEAVALDELLDRDALLLRKPGGCLVPESHGRALYPFVGSPRRHVLEEDGEPPRPDEDVCRRRAHLALGEYRQLCPGLA